MFKSNGIDVSKWQGTINWQKAKNDGVEFAIIRDGYGKKSPSQVDKKFKENLSGAKSAGINCGVYHYSYADSANDAILEAEFCLENIASENLEYPVCFDVEDKELTKLTTRQRTDICMAFCNEIEKNGYYAMIYSSFDWFRNKLFYEELSKKYDIWLAHWGRSEPSLNCGIWQTSEIGIIDGIVGNVDLNFAYKDYPAIMKEHGLNGFKCENEEITITPATPNQKTTYTVQKGDSLWKIAQKYYGDGTKYQKIKDLNGMAKDTIYPGQTLYIEQ